MDGNDGEDSSSMVGSTGSSAEGGASCGDSHSADSSESENETGTGDSHDSDEGASDSSSATASSESHVGSNDGHGDSVRDEQHSSPPSGGPGDILVTVSLQVVLVTVSLALVTVSLQMVLVLVSLQGKSLYPQIQLCLLCLYRNTSSKPRKTICDAIITPRIGGHVLVVRIGSIV